MTHDDDILMRRIDGELSPEAARRLDAEAEADPALAGQLAALRGLGEAARAAFPAEADPRDRDLARLIASSAPTPTRNLRDTLSGVLAQAFAPRPAAVWGGLAMATFAAGIVLGPILDRTDGLALGRDGAIAEAGLVLALDERLAADGADARGHTVGLTFRDDQGRWCRTFDAARAGVAGLACRSPDVWTLQVLAPSTAAEGEIRTASSAAPALVLDAVDALIDGEALDAAAERRARDAGWARP